MKNFLLVIKNEQSAKSMLEKTAIFLPESLILLCFDSQHQEKTKESLNALVKRIVKQQCEVQIFFESKETVKEMSEVLENYLSSIELDAVILHRPHLGQELADYSLIKAILQSSTRLSVFLCGDTRWKPEVKVLSAIDISDENDIQKKLNAKVFTVATEISKQLNGELGVLSIIPISVVSKELDIVEPSEVLSKQGQIAKSKLEAFIKQAGQSTDILIYLSAGSPPDEISSVSKKQKANIVVLGNVGRTGIKGLLVGNTAEKILSRLMVDAVIVKQ